MVDDTVRCPWHHACFSLRTGEAIGAPAFNPLSCWRVEKRDGKVFVRDKIEPTRPPEKATGTSDASGRIVIVGGGAAGFAAAEMLRREGFSGSLTMVSSDDAAPYDRPNCSKDYLAGNAPEEWMPLRPDDWYQEHAIDLMLRTEVTGIDAKARQITLAAEKACRSTNFYLRPAPSRSGSTSRAPTGRTCTCCARSRIRAPSWRAPRRRAAP
jgi:hypothetical protein